MHYLTHGRQERCTQITHAATQYHHLWAEHRDDIGDTRTDCGIDVIEESHQRSITGVSSLCHQCGRKYLAIGERLCQVWRVTLFEHLRCPRDDRRAACQCFEATDVPAATAWAVESLCLVAELTCSAIDPQVEVPPNHHTTTDAGPKGESNDIVGTTTGTMERLGQHKRARIIDEPNRASQ